MKEARKACWETAICSRASRAIVLLSACRDRLSEIWRSSESAISSKDSVRSNTTIISRIWSNRTTWDFPEGIRTAGNAIRFTSRRRSTSSKLASPLPAICNRASESVMPAPITFSTASKTNTSSSAAETEIGESS